MKTKSFRIKRGVRTAAMLSAMCLSKLAMGAEIESSLTSLGNDAWRYDYTLTNMAPALSFDELTIFFELPGIVGIDHFGVPMGWDPITIQPDASIPAGGYIDAVNLAGSVPTGSFSGFSALFHATSAPPATQAFQLLRSVGFVPVISGMTVAQVPEPGTCALMLGGLGILGWIRKRDTARRESERARISRTEGARA